MKSRLSLVIIVLCLPVILWQVSTILPTFDDFTTLQSPQFTSPWSSELLPNDSFWRPWDYLFGCLLGRWTWLFPTLNHIIIIMGHALSAWLVYTVCRGMQLGNLATNIATLFFFFSPASLGATLAVDGLNQTYAQLWGLLALYSYLNDRHKYILWPLLVLIAALSKENGLAWAVIPPVFAYAFGRISLKKASRDVGVGLCVAVLYFVARLALQVSAEVNNEYLDSSLSAHLKDLVQLLAYNWLPIDYASIVYAPSRNWMLAAVTLLTALPFLLVVAKGFFKQIKGQTLLCLILCYFIAASPHLLTLMSIMHNYATLALSAFILGYLANQWTAERIQLKTAAFALFIMTCIFTDCHHFLLAKESGESGRRLAYEAMNKTGTPVAKAYCISIDDGEPKYSSFGVPAIDAFGWGLSVRHYSHYQWPTEIADTLVSTHHVSHIADSVLRTGFPVVWIVSRGHIDVIARP